MHRILVQPVDRDAFAPFGDLIAMSDRPLTAINGQRFERVDALANVECEGAPVNIGLMRCVETTTLPCQIELVERHPHGSQAFLPLDPVPFVVVVGPASAQPSAEQFRGFLIPPRTGINMRAGIWHVPLLGSQPGQTFAVIDRLDNDNCDEVVLSTPLYIEASL